VTLEEDDRRCRGECVANSSTRLERSMLKRSTIRKKHDVRSSTERKARLGGEMLVSCVLMGAWYPPSKFNSAPLLKQCRIWMKASVFCSKSRRALAMAECGVCTEPSDVVLGRWRYAFDCWQSSRWSCIWKQANLESLRYLYVLEWI
jgi:hypothetical protein